MPEGRAFFCLILPLASSFFLLFRIGMEEKMEEKEKRPHSRYIGREQWSMGGISQQIWRLEKIEAERYYICGAEKKDA